MGSRRTGFANYGVAIAVQSQAIQHRFDATARQYDRRWSAWLPKSRESVILDLGCGCGEFGYFLLRRGYHNYTGVDLCKEEIVLGRRMGVSRLYVGDALAALGRGRNKYDLIVALNLFEHMNINLVLRALRLARRALKDGGRLIVVCPNGLSPFSGSTRYWDYTHVTGFTPASWRQLARLAKFRSVLFEDYGPMARNLPGICRVLAWQAIKAILDVISFVEVARFRDPSRVYTADMKVILQK